MDDFEELEGQGSVDFTPPEKIQAEPGQQTGEETQGEAPVLSQTVANSVSESRVEPFSRSGLEAPAEGDRTGQPKGETANDFSGWERMLLRSEKGGLGRKNSKYFRRVQDALEKTVGVLSKSFSNVIEDNRAMLLEACNAFQALLDACKQYTARNPHTKAGQVRRDLVLQIQEYAQRDLYGCGDVYYEFLSMPPQEQSKETWQAVLSRSRTRKLTVDDLSELEKASGGRASEVLKIESQEGDHTVTKYFKKEESIDVSAGIGWDWEEAPKYIALQETLKRFPKLSKNEKKQLREFVSSASESSMPFESSDSEPSMTTEVGKDALQFYKTFLEKNKVTIGALMLPLGIVDEGGEANMTRRNVATSRMAELLGLGNLIAKSQTVEIFDKASGKTIRGNLMDQAEGKEFNDVSKKLTNETERQLTSGFIRDSMNLQVLDMLCGQVDRHVGNMLYKTDEKGNVSGLQGIDNDAAFGTNIDASSSGERRDARVFDVNTGEMIIPYMDKDLADRIEALDSQVVRYVLSDLLKEEEINATIGRLEVLKRGIQKAKDEQKDKFLTEDDWSKAEVEKNLIESYNNEKQKFLFNKLGRKDIANKDAIREAYPNEPEMVEAVIASIEDKEKFRTYPEKIRKRVIKEKIKMEIHLYATKYRANRNYYGTFVDLTPYSG